MKLSENLEAKLEVICGITIIIAIFAALIGCIVYSYTKEPEEYKYTVVDKKESVGSYYNMITNKQVIDTNYHIILKDEGGQAHTLRVTLTEYYDYNVGRIDRLADFGENVDKFFDGLTTDGDIWGNLVGYTYAGEAPKPPTDNLFHWEGEEDTLA